MIPQQGFDLLATDCIFKGIEQSFINHYFTEFFTVQKLSPGGVLLKRCS